MAVAVVGKGRNLLVRMRLCVRLVAFLSPMAANGRERSTSILVKHLGEQLDE